MATWGIVLGCLVLLGAVIGAVLLLGSSHGRSPDAAAGASRGDINGNEPLPPPTFVRSPEKAAFTSASRSLAAANNTFTRSLAGNTGNSVSGIAQAVTPYATALTTFDYQLRQVSWSPNVQIQIETLS